ncbi:MAG: hypothetical protein ACTH7X_08585 [Brevibacterium aurantiacum]
MISEVPALDNGTEPSHDAAVEHELSGIKSKKQRFFLILLGQAGEKGATVGELREAKGSRYHHGSTSGLLSTLHSRDLVVALQERRDGQTVYVLPEHLNGREARPYGRRDPKLTEHNVLALLILEADLMEWGVSDKQLAQAAKRIVKELS